MCTSGSYSSCKSSWRNIICKVLDIQQASLTLLITILSADGSLLLCLTVAPVLIPNFLTSILGLAAGVMLTFVTFSCLQNAISSATWYTYLVEEKLPSGLFKEWQELTSPKYLTQCPNFQRTWKAWEICLKVLKQMCVEPAHLNVPYQCPVNWHELFQSALELSNSFISTAFGFSFTFYRLLLSEAGPFSF